MTAGRSGSVPADKFVGSVSGIKQRIAQTCFSKSGKNALHVFLVVAERTVFVLHLHGDDRATVRDLQRGQFPAQALQPALRRTQKPLIGAAQNDFRIGQQPRRQAAKVPLSADIRTGAEDDVETLFLRHSDKCGYVEITAEIVDSGLGFVNIPEDVRRNRIQTHRLRLLKAISPVFVWNASVVDFTGDNLKWFFIEYELVAFNLDTVGRRCGRALAAYGRAKNRRKRETADAANKLRGIHSWNT